MLVGDFIVSVRELGPDPCNVVPALSTPTLTGTTGGTFTPGQKLYIVLTTLNQWGESNPSVETSITLGGGQTAVSMTANYLGWPSGTVAVRVYYGSNPGAEINYEQFTIPAAGFASPITIINSPLPGFPPSVSRAYLPDSDGGFASAFAMYRWLNESLKTLARAAGGIQDSCGIASVSGQRRYVAPGQWIKFAQCFYDGWELDLGNKAETFRNRNLTANISISLMVDAQSDTTRIELYWTPSRTAGASTTSATLASSDTNVSINAPTGWLLQDGFAQVGAEIISYSSQTSTQLTNIIRGWSGTNSAASLASGAAVSELNIELTGYRMPATYSVGQSAFTVGVPPGWEPFIKDYMLGLFRSAEQETQEGLSLMKKATDGIEAWVKSNKPVAGPRQCRMYGDYGIRGLVPGGLTGGIIIP